MDLIFAASNNVRMAKPPFDARPAPSSRSRTTLVRHYLREWRRYRNLTQEQLAGRADVSRGLIAQYESGLTKIPEDMMYALADALQCDSWDLWRVNPEKDGDIIDITDELRGMTDADRARALGYIRGLKDQKTG